MHTGSKCNTTSHASVYNLTCKLTKFVKHLALFHYAQGLRLALYKGLHALLADLYKRWLSGGPATAPYG